MHIDNIELAEPFMNLFPRRAELEDELAADMEQDGFDDAFPLIVWENVLVDGYHRYYAAEKNRIFDIPVNEKAFDDEDAAIMYCIRTNATRRRHLTDAEMVKAVREADRINKAAANERMLASLRNQDSSLADNQASGKSANQTATDVGISRNKVEEVRAIEKYGTEQDIKDIETGKSTIHKKAEEVKRRRQRQLAPTDYRTENQKEFDEAYARLKFVLIKLRQAQWEGVGFEGIQQNVWALQDIARKDKEENYEL